MTPLAQQIARLLAPEHWDEWKHAYIGSHYFKRNLSVALDPLVVLIGNPTVDPTVDPMVSITERLGWMERRVIARMVEDMRLGVAKRAEERAIEELLR